MKEGSKEFKLQKNPEKAEARLHINSFLMGGLLTVLALIWTFNPDKFSIMIIAQLVMAIPLILFASLSYAKMGYERSHVIWDRFGWITTNLGYLLFLNATGLILAEFSFRILTFLYFGLIILLSVLYYSLNIISQPGTLKEHLSKLILFIIVITLGGIVPFVLH
jgi:hypothetical protein